MSSLATPSCRRAAAIAGHVAASAPGNLSALTGGANAGDEKAQAKAEREEFLAIFDVILAEVLRDLPRGMEMPPEAVEWVRRLCVETIPGGKMNRGLTVAHTLVLLRGRDAVGQAEIFKAHVLGWCIEILQAFFLVADDIMDASMTRRGEKCWYRKPHPMGDKNNPDETIGLIAINDSFILEGIIYRLLYKYFKEEPYYADLVNIFHDVSFRTELGQLLDLTSNLPGGRVDLSLFTTDTWEKIVKYKTAYYSFQLPVAAAMMLAGIRDEPAFQLAEDILIPMGEYFQAQDDYLDCYGSPEVIGKVGRDIEENKCGWLIVQALLRADDRQKKLLAEHYGRDNPDDVAVVKKVYKELDLERVFKEYEDASFAKLSEMINLVHSMPRAVFSDLLQRIYKRSI